VLSLQHHDESGRSVTADRCWKRRFEDPIPLPSGRCLVTLEDAGNYITKLPKAEHQAREWRVAMEALISGACPPLLRFNSACPSSPAAALPMPAKIFGHGGNDPPTAGVYYLGPGALVRDPGTALVSPLPLGPRRGRASRALICCSGSASKSSKEE
jgi:hypothetical protein